MRVLIASAALLVTACINQATTDLEAMLEQRYADRALDDFILNHGPPTSSATLSDGRNTHMWLLGVGQQSFTTGAYNGAAGFGSLTGFSTPLECRVQVIEQNETIDSISILSNTEGVNRITRCGEMLRFD